MVHRAGHVALRNDLHYACHKVVEASVAVERVKPCQDARLQHSDGFAAQVAAMHRHELLQLRVAALQVHLYTLSVFLDACLRLEELALYVLPVDVNVHLRHGLR